MGGVRLDGGECVGLAWQEGGLLAGGVAVKGRRQDVSVREVAGEEGRLTRGDVGPLRGEELLLVGGGALKRARGESTWANKRWMDSAARVGRGGECRAGQGGTGRAGQVGCEEEGRAGGGERTTGEGTSGVVSSALKCTGVKGRGRVGRLQPGEGERWVVEG